MENIGYVQTKDDRREKGEKKKEHYYSKDIKHQIYHTLTDMKATEKI
jgi:hypothetical protein